ncbi:MAG: DUF1398 family protein [Vallitaleaceae bacterium]|nr:DUF1398 family protein [Vallitaleaceae bacterium]
MMFTKEQIETAHDVVENGADFPKYLKALKAMGVKNYEISLRDGNWVYAGEGDYTISFKRGSNTVAISDKASPKKFLEVLKNHQVGETDYDTFCIQAGEVGVEKWRTDLENKVITYIDVHGTVMLREPLLI